MNEEHHLLAKEDPTEVEKSTFEDELDI